MPPCGALGFQFLATVRKALLHFSDRIQPFDILAVLVLDVGVDSPLVVAQQAQVGADGRVALAKRQVGAVVPLAVLDVQRHDAAVLLPEVFRGIAVGGGEVVDIEIDARVFRCALHGAGEGLSG